MAFSALRDATRLDRRPPDVQLILRAVRIERRSLLQHLQRFGHVRALQKQRAAEAMMGLGRALTLFQHLAQKLGRFLGATGRRPFHTRRGA